MSEFSLAAFIAAVFLLAGGIKGVLGLGLPTVGMGLLSIVMTPAQAAGILVIPALATNVWQVASGPALLSLLRRFALMIVATVVGTFSTVEFLTGSSQSTPRVHWVQCLRRMRSTDLSDDGWKFTRPPSDGCHRSLDS